MHCPFCDEVDSKVIDSRLVSGGSDVRRRRECLTCSERFTTYESAELVMPLVIKNDGTREPFNEGKLTSGLRRALEKRPVSAESIDKTIVLIKQEIRSGGEREINSSAIGSYVMNALRGLDEVAYVRFASVYKSFQDISEFRAAVDMLQE